MRKSIKIHILSFLFLLPLAAFSQTDPSCNLNFKKFKDSATKYFYGNGTPRDIGVGLQWCDAAKTLCKDYNKDLEIDQLINEFYKFINKELTISNKLQSELRIEKDKAIKSLNIANKFKMLFEFDGELCSWAYQDQFFAVVDSLGNKKGEFEYENPQPFHNNLAIAQLNGKYVFVGSDGKPKNVSTYDYLINHVNNTYYAIHGKKHTILSGDGMNLSQLIVDTCHSWKYKIYPTIQSDGSKQILAGNEFTPIDLKYTKFKIQDGLFWYIPSPCLPSNNNKWGIRKLDLLSPNLVEPGKYSTIYTSAGKVLFAKTDKSIVKLKSGEEMALDTLINLKNGYFVSGKKAHKEMHFGLIDSTGNQILRPSFKLHTVEYSASGPFVAFKSIKNDTWQVLNSDKTIQSFHYEESEKIKIMDIHAHSISFQNFKYKIPQNGIKTMDGSLIVLNTNGNPIKYDPAFQAYNIENITHQEERKKIKEEIKKLKHGNYKIENNGIANNGIIYKFLDGTDGLIQIKDDSLWRISKNNNVTFNKLSNFNEITPLENGYYLCRNSTKSVLINRHGNIVKSLSNIEAVDNSAKNYILVKRDGKWGCIDYHGNLLIPFEFSESSHFKILNDSFIWVKDKKNTHTYSGDGDLFALNLEDGRILNSFNPFDNNYQKQIPKIAYLANGDSFFKMATSAAFSNKTHFKYASRYTNGMALVLKENQEWSLMDTAGNLKSITFNNKTSPINLEYLLNPSTALTVLSPQFKIALPLNSQSGYMPVLTGTNTWKYLGADGKFKNDSFDVITLSDPSSNKCLVKYKGKHELTIRWADKDFQNIPFHSNYFYDNVSEGYIRITVKDPGNSNKFHYSFLNQNGLQLDNKFEFATNMHNGLVLIKKDNRWSYIIDPSQPFNQFEKTYEDAKPFDKNVAFVKDNSKWQLINTKGSIMKWRDEKSKPLTLNITNFYTEQDVLANTDTSIKQLSYASRYFSEGVAVAVIKASKGNDNNSKWGIVNTKASILVPFEFDSIMPLQKNIWLLKKNGRFGLYMAENDTIIDTKYQVIGNIETETGWLRVNKNGKWGWIDKNGKRRIEFRYIASTPFINGKAWVIAEPYDKPFQINTNGEMILSSIKTN